MEENVNQSAAASENAPNNPQNKVKSEVFEWIKAIVIALVLVFVIRWLLFAPYMVDGTSMEPNFHNSERVIVNKILYDIRPPKKGEVIVFKVPSEDNKEFIKRVIALPGDTVKVEGDVVTVNGEVISEPYIQDMIDAAKADGGTYNNNTNFPNPDFPDGTVPEGHVFAMGDNRPNSKDSRMIGYVPYSDITGRADLVFWPFSDIHIVNH
ncbi:signal peptidase I [Saccharibacillus kuerlensis]|uniref:Signal peptidase I n=1 Tax=Saccharibacillus kuerlensis TaxID=459527 RepID=A0ABQ2KS08_9BACL|nr:signal peptidase I [Saccharibacillus kuerlensis]GGN90554.1 signal peptidase I [Saccharibacillus kuerlensis]